MNLIQTIAIYLSLLFTGFFAVSLILIAIFGGSIEIDIKVKWRSIIELYSTIANHFKRKQ